MTEYDNTDRGALFKNDRKERESQPDYRGSLNVGGTDYWISAWLNESRDGKKYMSLSVQPKQAQDHQGAPRNPPVRTESEVPRGGGNDFDDDIPF